MKKVFSNSAMVAHVWAQCNQTEGRASTGNMYFNSDAIYSYGSHFPLAKFLDANTVLINTDSYSVTTQKHKQEVRQSLPGAITRIYTNTAIIKRVVSGHSSLLQPKAPARKELIDLITRNVSALIVWQAAIAAKRRKPELKERDIAEAISFYNNQVELLEFYKLKMPASVTHLIEQLKTDLSLVVIANEKQLKAAAKKRAKAQAIEAARLLALAEEALVTWRRGEELPYNTTGVLRYLPAVALRVINDNIETTQGATFPVEHGVKAFKVIARVKSRNETWQRNGHTIHLGHFQIDTVTPEGDVIAGCHTVPYGEIEAVAKQLKLI